MGIRYQLKLCELGSTVLGQIVIDIPTHVAIGRYALPLELQATNEYSIWLPTAVVVQVHNRRLATRTSDGFVIATKKRISFDL